MVGFFEIMDRIKYWRNADRIGPDILLTHWRLYFRTTMRDLCIKKFKHFGVGAEFRPGSYAEACSKIVIGNRVVIRPGTFLFADPREGGAGIIIEDEVLIGSGVHFYTNNHEFSDASKAVFDQGYPEAQLADEIILRQGCWIGAGVIILPGVEVGRNAVIGAGSVVTRSVPPCAVAVGNPAKVVREI